MVAGPRSQLPYNAARIQQLKGATLPAKLRCYRCNKFKNQTAFSKKQLDTARLATHNAGPGAKYNIFCTSCNGGQVTELQCSVCGYHKGLECFAKSQRRMGDQAECYECVEKRLEQVPISEETYTSEDQTRAFQAPESSNGYMPSVSDASTNVSDTASQWKNFEDRDRTGTGEPDGIPNLAKDLMWRMSISESSTSQSAIERGSNEDNGTQNLYSWNQVAATKPWKATSAYSTSTNTSVFDPNKYGKPSSTLSTSGSQHSFASSYVERSDAPRSKSGWPKIKAYDPKKDPNLPSHRTTTAPTASADHWSSDEDEGGGDGSDEDDSDAEIPI